MDSTSPADKLDVEYRLSAARICCATTELQIMPELFHVTCHLTHCRQLQ